MLKYTLQLYIRALLALAAFDDGRYSEAADLLNDSILSIADWFSRRTSFEPELKLFAVVRHYNVADHTSIN
jgi:hypothetical protein